MADRPQDTEWEYGTGNGHDRSEEEKRQLGGGEERREGGRWYREAQERRMARGQDDHLLGMGYASPTPTGRTRGMANYPFEQRDDRGGRWRGARYEGGEWRRQGMQDYGYPAESQGRGVYERYSERDFPGRDARYAGRSGYGYVPGSEQTQGWHPPEEDWEREHLHYRDRAEERRAQAWEHEPTEARDIMTKNPRFVDSDASLRDVARIMHDEDTGIVPVCDATRRLVGLITDRDMVIRTFDEERSWADIRVREVMTDDVHAVTPEESVHDTISLMGKKQIRRVPVVDRNDRLVGMVSMADIANRADRDEELQHALDRISRRRSFWSRLWS
ncbi:MAG: CBS domain-containing protein [Myxococcaceae bacterium]